MKEGFTVQESLHPPTIVSIDPKTGKQGDSVVVTVTGKNTHFLAGSFNVELMGTLSGVYPQSVKIENDSIAKVKFKLRYIDDVGDYNFSVFNLVDGALKPADKFKITAGNNPPKLTSVSPNTAAQGQSMDLIVKGTKDCFNEFVYGSIYLSNASTGNQIIPVLRTPINDSTLKLSFEFVIQSGYLGEYDLVCKSSNAAQQLILPGAFTLTKRVILPSIVSVTPDSGTQFDSVLVTIKCKATHFSSKQPVVTIRLSDGSTYLMSQMGKVINDTTVQTVVHLGANYYASPECDVLIFDVLDSTITKKNAFTIKRIYQTEPRITKLEPPAAFQGESVIINIKGDKGTFLPINNITVSLTLTLNSFIYADAVNYVNDSLITASFIFSSSIQPGPYSLIVNDKARLWYNSFRINEPLHRLTEITPSFASPTDTITASIKGRGTHFLTTDSLWLQSKFSTKIYPFSTNPINDSLISARFAFKQSDLPGLYSVMLSNAVDKTMSLKDAFTLTGSIDNTSLLNVIPNIIMAGDSRIVTIKATQTHFLSDAEKVVFVDDRMLNAYNSGAVKIVDDTTIEAEATLPYGTYSIMVLGKENYMLTGKLTAFPPLSVPKVEEQAAEVFPNPSSGVFTLNVNQELEQALLSVFDIYGKEIIKLDKIDASTQLDLETFSNGIYFIKLIKNNTCKTMKIIKN
jgi:hypothetical protein